MNSACAIADAERDRVVDDPTARMELSREAAARHGAANVAVAPYAQGELAFLEWEIRRGSMNPLDAPQPGSAWWRAVNGELIRDCVEAHVLLDDDPVASTGSTTAVDEWLAFYAAPSPASWYRAHNRSIIDGYVRFASLAGSELNAEQDFIGTVLLRVLAAEAAVNAAPIDMGPLGVVLVAQLADPRSGGVREVTAIEDFYPRNYPLELSDIDRLAHRGHHLGRLAVAVVDDMVKANTAALVEWAADAHGIEELRKLLDGNTLVYPQGLFDRADGAMRRPRTTPFTDGELETLRSVSDPDADHVVGLWFHRNDDAHPAAMLAAAITTSEQPGAQSARDVVSAFIGDRTPMPAWVDHDALVRASDFFSIWGVEILLMLGCSSLPDSYAAKKGVQVLHLTARLETDTKRRLIETTQMVIDVLTPRGLEVGGQGRTTVRKVRLMHAGIRYMIANDSRIEHTTEPVPGGSRWDPDWGTPINQEDLLGTLTTFTWNVIEGLRLSGVPVSEQEAEDWVHTWNVVGHLIGIPDDHLPADYATTSAIAVAIRRRNHGPSPEGKAMTADLMATMRQMIPLRIFDGFPQSLAGHVLPADVAEMVGIGRPDWTRFFFGPFRGFVGGVAPKLRDRTTRRVVARLGHRFLDMAEEFERGSARPPFAIPSQLAGEWGRAPSGTDVQPSDGFSPQRARGPWVAEMGMDHVIAGHWRVDAGALRALVPPQLELDEFDGSPWVSVLVLDMDSVRFRGLRPLPGQKSFAEVNIRTYVKHQGRRGVWFLSIDTHSGAIVWLSRAVFRQPYHRADVSYSASPLGGRLESTRLQQDEQGGGGRLVFDYTVGDAQGDPAAAGSLGQFLSERYWMFRTTGRGAVRSTALSHAPWAIKPAEIVVETFESIELCGIELVGPPDSADWAGSVKSRVFLPQP